MQLSMLPNDVKLTINVIDQLETDFFMEKYIAISSVGDTIKKLHIQKHLYLIYQQDLYRDKKRKYMNFYFIPCSRLRKS